MSQRRNESVLTLYPMPDIRSAAGSATEKNRLFELEEKIRQAEAEICKLRNQLVKQQKIAEEAYAEAYEAYLVGEKKKQQPTHTPRVGFDHPETWWQWTKRVILKS